jgi:tetratricopeptide (TPR) repeat protein
MSQQNQSEKILRLKRYIELDPHNTLLRIELGDLYFQDQEWEDAAVQFEAVVVPDSSVARSRLASVRLAQCRFSEAASLIQDLLEAGEKNAALHFNLGLALLFQSHFDKAGEQFIKAREEGLDHPDIDKYLTHSRHHEGALAAAMVHCEAWLASGGGAAAQAYLARLHFDGGEREAAHVAATTALAIDASEPEALAVMGALALEEQRFGDAAQAFEGILAQSPEHGRAWLGKGLGLLHERQFEPAIAALESAAARMPNHAGTTVTLGWAYLLSGAHAQAETALQRAIDVDRNFSEAHGGLAAVLAIQGRLEEATHAIAVADRLDPRNFGSVYAKAALLRAAGRDDSANALLQRALEAPLMPGVLPLFTSLKALLRAG